MKIKGLTIGPYCLISENLRAENSTIGPYCEIKKNVTLSSNVVLQGRNRIAQNCVIDDNVIIKYGTILTDYVHIKENTFIGPNVIIFGDDGSRSGARTTTIGSNCFIGGGAKINAGINIGDNIIIGASSFVNKDCLEEGTYVGSPIKKIK